MLAPMFSNESIVHLVSLSLSLLVITMQMSAGKYVDAKEQRRMVGTAIITSKCNNIEIECTQAHTHKRVSKGRTHTHTHKFI